MPLSATEAKKQFNRVKAKGWLPHFEEAVAKFTKGYFDVADLIAIASRETELNPIWLTKPGDGGNGYGLMQADLRSFPEWIKTGKWKDAREGILKGAEILMQKWRDTQTGIGVKRGVRSSKTGKTSYFIGKDVGQGKEAQQVTIAAYNNGRWPHYAVSNGKDVDTYTTGKNYSKDVMGRARQFRSLLKASATASPVNSGSAHIPQQPASKPQSEPPPTTTEVIVENIENVSTTPAPPPPSDKPTKVTVERVSVWSKVGAGIAAITGIGINFSNLVNTRLNDMTLTQLGYVLGGVAIIAAGLWLYDRAAKRAHEKTLAKMATAADPSQTTVELREWVAK